MYLHVTLRKDCPLWDLCVQLSLPGHFTTSCTKKQRVQQKQRPLRHPNLPRTSQHLPNSWEGWCTSIAEHWCLLADQAEVVSRWRGNLALWNTQLWHHPVGNMNWNKTRNVSLQVDRGILLCLNQNSSLRWLGCEKAQEVLVKMRSFCWFFCFSPPSANKESN